MDEYSYFETELEWMQQNPMQLILQSSGLHPNKNYSRKDFISKLTDQLGCQPTITCKDRVVFLVWLFRRLSRHDS